MGCEQIMGAFTPTVRAGYLALLIPAKAGDRAEETHRAGGGAVEQRRGRRQRPGLELLAARPPGGGVDEVADRELIARELLVGHVDVVGEHLVADLLEAHRLEAARVADLRVARR